MNKEIQPKYNLAKVVCSNCNAKFELGSVMESIKIETCSNCHPFYTGKQKNGNVDGRVEKFKNKYKLK